MWEAQINRHKAFLWLCPPAALPQLPFSALLALTYFNTHMCLLASSTHVLPGSQLVESFDHISLHRSKIKGALVGVPLFCPSAGFNKARYKQE